MLTSARMGASVDVGSYNSGNMLYGVLRTAALARYQLAWRVALDYIQMSTVQSGNRRLAHGHNTGRRQTWYKPWGLGMCQSKVAIDIIIVRIVLCT